MPPRIFTDPEFNQRMDNLRAREIASRSLRVYEAGQQHNELQQKAEQQARLATTATEVAAAAREDEELPHEMVNLYEHWPKLGFKKFLNNRGPMEHVESGRGWIIAPAKGGALASSTTPQVGNVSNMGLVLTEEGELYGYLELGRRDKLPVDSRPPFVHVNRKKNPLDKGPTLLMPISDPHNELATPRVIEQSFAALASFVQRNQL